MTAREAKNLADVNSKKQERMAKVLDEIASAAAQGNYTVGTNVSLDGIYADIENLGYKITSAPFRSKYDYYIYW